MALEYDIIANGREVDRHLPHLSSSIDTALWIRCANGAFTQKDFEDLFRSFSPLRAVVWYTHVAKDMNNAQESHSGSSKNLPTVIATINTAYPQFGLPATSIVEWANPAKLPSIVYVAGSGNQSILSFVSDERRVAKQWSRIVHGIVWLWICQDWVANEPTPKIDAHSVVLSYIRMTLAINGVAGLIWKDSDSNMGFTFFASTETLQNAAMQLHNCGAIASPEIFARLCTRGFYFEPCK